MTANKSCAPVSVIIPCFNCAHSLERAVLSIVEQSVKPFEVILVDDASSDLTLEVITRIQRQYGCDWIQVIQIKENCGPATARNAGWDVASQPYLAFLDADDSWHSAKIETQWKYMEAHPEIDLCGHGFSEINTERVIAATNKASRYEMPTLVSLLFSNRLATRTVMLRRSKKYRFREGKRFAEDYLLWLQMVCDGHRAALLGEQLAYTYKASYGVSGLSANLWGGEKGELEAYRILADEKRISKALSLIVSIYSLLKYLRRLVLVCGRERQDKF